MQEAGAPTLPLPEQSGRLKDILSANQYKPFDVGSLCFYNLVLERLCRKAAYGFISFHDVDTVIGRFNLIHAERVKVMKELEKAGYVELIPLKGWRLQPSAYATTITREEIL